MPEKKKRKYTFRKDQPIPYEADSIIHEVTKSEREMGKTIASALESPKKRKRR